MSDPVEGAQGAVILAAAQRLWPRCRHLKVLRHDDGRWLVTDEESQIWWEARPGGASRDPSGYHRPDTVAFTRVTWAPRTPEDLVAAEQRGDIPGEEIGESWI